MSEAAKTIGVALVVSVLTTAGNQMLSAGATQRLLEDNIAVVKELNTTVTNLRLMIAEKYVTKEELERRLSRPSVTLADGGDNRGS